MSGGPTTKQKLRVAYLGPPASFSHQAAIEAFPTLDSDSFIPLPSFEAILSAIQNSASHSNANNPPQAHYDYALLPVENSTNGGVVPVLDLLVQSGQQAHPAVYPDIEIVDEHYLQVHHNLFCHESIIDKANSNGNGFPDDLPNLNIKILYSHPQVWGQCGKFLTKYFPLSTVERIHMSSTSAAAAFVASHPSQNANDQPPTTSPASAVPKASKQGNIAAICSSLAGQQNGLVNLASNIEDEPGQNTTRFFVIRNRHPQSEHGDLDQPPVVTASSRTAISWKSLVTFTIPHAMPGSLAAALAIFSGHHFNLTAITTRPSRDQPWHYVFFVECEEERVDNADGSRVRGMLGELGTVTERSTLLGSWINRLKHKR